MPDDDATVDARKAFKNGEPTQRFSALQPQLLCAAIHFFHRHIRNDPDVLQRMEGNQMFRLFFEVPYHNKPDLNRIFPESVHDCSPLHVCSFILSILHQGIFSVSAFIVSVIYLSRFKEVSHITLHACTWRPLFLTSLLLADKMWEDKPVRNSSLAKLFPVLNNQELNRMESEFLVEIRFNVLVKPDLFCSFCEKLLAEKVHSEIKRCVENSEYAATLQQDQLESAQPPPKLPKQVSNDTDFEGIATQESSKSLRTKQQQQQQLLQEQQQHQQHSQQQHHSHSQVATPHQAPLKTDLLAAPQSSRATVGGHGFQRPGQAWMDKGAHVNGVEPGAPPPGKVGNEGSSLVPRSHSAGPTTGANARRGEALGARPTPGDAPQLRTGVPGQPHATSAREHSLGSRPTASTTTTSSAAVPGTSAKALGQQATRSVSVHPLNRNESMKKHPVSKADEPQEKSARQGHQPAHYAALGTQPLRRSLPAKTSNPTYMPLARAPSVGGTASAGLAQGHHSQQPLATTASLAGHEAPQVGCGGHTGGSVGIATSRASQSPRSPTNGAASVHLPHEQTPQHQSQALHQPQPHPMRSTSQGRVTPPVPTTASQHMGAAPCAQSSTGHSGAAKLQQPRGASPGTLIGQQQQSQQQPPLGTGAASGGASQTQPHSRASSAPRAQGLQQHTQPQPVGSNVRTASQSLQSAAARQTGPPCSAPGGYPGGPAATSPSPIAQGQHTHFGQAVLFPASPSVRGASPAPTQVGGVPVALRGTLGGGGTARNPSPIGLGSPAGNMHTGQTPFGSMAASPGSHRPDVLSATSRGRSPPPVTTAAGSGALRQPRAVTPSSLVKGITQGIHQAGMVQRGSLGTGASVHRGY